MRMVGGFVEAKVGADLAFTLSVPIGVGLLYPQAR